MGCMVAGVCGISLVDEFDKVVGMICIDFIDMEIIVFVVFEKGMGKCFDFQEYCLINCGGKGVRMMMVMDKIGGVVVIKVVNDDVDLMIISCLGVIIWM